jgi:hypothetical protein
MATREIPQEEWIDFLDGFSRRHERWLATVQVLGDLGAQTEADSLPFEGVTADRHAPHAITVLLQDSSGGEVAHSVPSPSRLLVEEREGSERALEIESKEGEKTIMSFRSAVPPEEVNGILSP